MHLMIFMNLKCFTLPLKRMILLQLMQFMILMNIMNLKCFSLPLIASEPDDTLATYATYASYESQVSLIAS